MPERQDWDEVFQLRDGRCLLMRYAATGTALALLRVALLVWVNHRQLDGAMTETVLQISWGLYPEGFVFARVFGQVGFTPGGYYSIFGSLLTVGSFILATPILLLGWLRQRCR
jgi:hypothetical protein